MTDDVLVVKYSKNQKVQTDIAVGIQLTLREFLAAALLDNTVKVFFADTLKFYLSLYGHKVR